MSSANRLTSKGQVTVPIGVRRKLGLKPGDAVEFADVESAVTIRKARPTPAEIDAMLDAIAGSADRRLNLTTDEIMDEIRPYRLDLY